MQNKIYREHTEKEEKKKILIVEDEMTNREILAKVLEDSYEILTAENGTAALEIIEVCGDMLSLVLLDLNLPDIQGLEIMKIIQDKRDQYTLPVIVLTADKDAEVDSLTLGASDFIPKPYPRPEVIRARVKRTIELSEDRIIIEQTEHDQLTGLYTREFFYSYAEQFDSHHHEDMEMDAIAVSINHFHLINERYGREYADEVLKRVADNIRKVLDESDGIACRSNADNYLIYCPHRSDYTEMLTAISEGAAGEETDSNAVRLRMGVYPKADKSIDIERRFDRAKLAADTVRSAFTKAVAIYDSELHESAIFSEQLLIDFQRAIEEEEFRLYYQPKYYIRGDEPVLCSAEALIRWDHPKFGLLSPGLFIELFERNGMIEQMDAYVWEHAAMQIQDWRERLGVRIPVSVNVSRVDMFDPEIISHIDNLAKKYGLDNNELILEVTESAYTEDSDLIVTTVENFRDLGFFIEMDDFGSGYSSLSMLSNLPIDALKLDMEFIRTAFGDEKNTRMLEIVIEIAASLDVPVIAEGVETAEQLLTLKIMGCDIVQGYFFSAPVPPEKFERFIIESKGKGCKAPIKKDKGPNHRLLHDKMIYEALHDSMTGAYNRSAFNLLLYDADRPHCTLLLADIANYDDIVKNEGGDEAVRTIVSFTDVLKTSFRASDFVCRLDVHKFGVILTRVNGKEDEVITEKVRSLRTEYAAAGEGSSAAEISFALVYGDVELEGLNMYEEAEKILKEGGNR